MCPRGLNEEQRRAVLIQEDRTLIVARAETGKTHTMVEKARDTVRTGIASPSDIAFVTFTRKAAQEIRSRSTDLEGMEVGTLHDLARLVIEMAKGRRPRLSPFAEDDGARLENIEAWLVEAADTSRPALTRETTADTAAPSADGSPMTPWAFRTRSARGRLVCRDIPGECSQASPWWMGPKHQGCDEHSDCAEGLVARLGRWLGRTRDPPGAQLMWHGYTQLVAIAFAFELRDEYG